MEEHFRQRNILRECADLAVETRRAGGMLVQSDVLQQGTYATGEHTMKPSESGKTTTFF